MAKFPVEINDDEGIVDAVNNLLSGPSGLGQNFAGFSSYSPAYLTGNYRTPFTWPTLRNLYVAPIALSTAEFIDSRTLKFTFASAQPSPPFEQGNPINITGSSESWYDGYYTTIGVVSCTTTYCYVRLSSDNTTQPTGTGGTIGLDIMDSAISTDCNARVTVTGGTDRVFISGQLDQKVHYEVLSGTQDLNVSILVNRYQGFLNDDPVNPDYLFNFDGTVAEKVYTITGLTGTGYTDLIETVYSTLLDTPAPGYYWYILEVTYSGTDIQVLDSDFGLRSLSTQVVKQ
jgi:hypothetical protein